MGNRISLSILVFCLPSLVIPPCCSSQSQMGSEEPSREIRWGGFLGIDPFPTPRGVLGVHLLTPIVDPVSGRFEYSYVTSGFVSCDDAWPGSYDCSMTGHSVLLGAEVESQRDSGMRPYVDLGLGAFFRRGGPEASRVSFAPAAGFGVRFSAKGIVSWKLFLRRSWMFDEAYADLMGKGLGLSYLAWEMEIQAGK